MKNVILQEWEESERGWGVRPDGWSLHLTPRDRSDFIRDYWARQPDVVPDEYSRPSRTEPVMVEVTDEVYEKIRKTKNGLMTMSPKDFRKF